MEDLNQKSPNFQFQLQNLSEIQARIQETRRSLNQLLKIQGNQTKNLESIYKLSKMTARNKLNLLQFHSLNNKRQSIEAEQVRKKQEKVKEMKEKVEREMKQIKNEMKRNKENERLVIRNNSMQYDQAIKKNKKLEIQRKEEKVKEIKKEKQQHKEKLMHSRMQEQQQKQIQLFHSTLAKIERTPSLTKELNLLMKKKEEIQRRVEQRREMKEKMKLEIDRLKKMKEDEFVKVVQNGQTTEPILKHVSSHIRLQSIKGLKAQI